MLILTLKAGREQALLDGHPWIYAAAIARVEGRPAERAKPGVTALVQSATGRFLARAAHSPKSNIRARVWTFDPNEAVDHALIKRRVQAALALRYDGRQRARDVLTTLVIGEEDRLPGLTVRHFNRGAGYLICRFDAAGVDAWKTAIVQSLMAGTGCPNVYQRDDETARAAEGLPVASRSLAGEDPPHDVAVVENGTRFLLDLRSGEKWLAG
jgi:23S rRNA (cytosine1962-C5)-methyltransferase